MRARGFVFLLALGALLVAFPSLAQECDGPEARECVDVQNQCADQDNTTVQVQLGGQGSLSSNDGDCGGMDCDDPGKLGDGTLGQAIYTFDYTRSTGKLLVTVQNTTCTTSTLFDIFFNVSRDGGNNPRVTSMSLAGTTSVRNPRNNHNWQLLFDSAGCTSDHQASGFGYFDVALHNLNGNPTSEIYSNNGSFGQVTFEIDVQGAADLTACDFVTQGSRKKGEGGFCVQLSEGDKSTFAAGKFQRGVQGGSGTISPCNGEGDLLVEMREIEARPSDGQVEVAWTTASEIETIGFQVWRTNLTTGESVRLTDRLIPSRGGPTQSATYGFVDETAINGVEYKYFVTDMDYFGTLTTHFPETAIPNPTDPKIWLLAPTYGEILPLGSKGKMVFGTQSDVRLTVEIGADPTFAGTTIRLKTKSADGTLSTARFGKRISKKLAKLAAHGDGHLYWRVVSDQNVSSGTGVRQLDELKFAAGQRSATHRVAFD